MIADCQVAFKSHVWLMALLKSTGSGLSASRKLPVLTAHGIQQTFITKGMLCRSGKLNALPNGFEPRVVHAQMCKPQRCELPQS